MRKRIVVGLFLIAVAFSSAGCALFSSFTSLSPLNQAIVLADQSNVWYQATYKDISNLYDSSTPEKQAWLKKEVNPKMNKLKGYIVSYIDLVNLWKLTGQEPTDIPNIASQIRILTSDVITALKEK